MVLSRPCLGKAEEKKTEGETGHVLRFLFLSGGLFIRRIAIDMNKDGHDGEFILRIV